MPDRKIFSFKEIVDTISTKIAGSSSLTDFSDGSNNKSMVESYAYFIEFLQAELNKAFDSFSIKNTSGTDLDTRVQDYNIQRKAAAKTQGVMTFAKSSAASSSFTIAADSQVSTQPDLFGKTVDYVTLEDVLFPSGAISVTGMVECTEAGTIGNQPASSITNITTSIPGIDTVVNLVPFVSGANKESDSELKNRVSTTINGLKAGNEAAIKAAALTIPGITVARVSAGVPSVGHITVYVSSQSGELTTEQLDAIKAEVEKVSAFGILVDVAAPTIIYIALEMNVTYDTSNYAQNLIDANIRNAVFDLVSVNPDTTLKLLDISFAVAGVPGVQNVKGLKINGVADDYSVDGFASIKLASKNDSITINYL